MSVHKGQKDYEHVHISDLNLYERKKVAYFNHYSAFANVYFNGQKGVSWTEENLDMQE